MNTKTLRKQLLAVVLSMLMVLGLMIPAFAAGEEDGYDINIYPNKFTLTPDEENDLAGRFHAYQIFAGELSKDYDGDSEDGEPLKQPNANQLSNVTWGSAVTNHKGLIEALVADTTEIGETTLGEAILKALTEAGYEFDKDEDGKNTLDENTNEKQLSDAANIIAHVLSDLNSKNNAALARAFVDVVAAKGEEGYLYLDEEEAIESTWPEDSDDHWNIHAEDAGYYVIVDTYHSVDGDGDGETDKANSDYLAGVFGTTNIYVKSDAPTVDKEIVEGETPEGTSSELGKVITFRLTGTIAENYPLFDEYFYEFVDTMSKGLTYDGNLHIYAVDKDDNKYEISIDESGITVKTETAEDGKTTLTVTIEDLKEILATEVQEEGAETDAKTITGEDLDNTWTIVVEYEAYLNDDALVIENVNSVTLEYSNDPNSDDHGKTHEEFVYVYDFGLDIFKYDLSKVENDELPEEGLDGAGFSVSKVVGEGEDAETLYAIFAKREDGKYYIAGWISEEALGDDVVWDKEYKADELGNADWNKGEPKEDVTYRISIVTANKGQLFFGGMEADVEYTITETITPDGFDTLENPIKVEYTATYFEEDTADFKKGQLESLTVSIDGEDQEIVKDGYLVNAEDDVKANDNLYATLAIANTPSGWLPGTGGIGTYLFYIAGSVLLAGAALYLIITAVKKNKN